ncbi:MAG: crossover junction endodeoxyribonuclease RuvC [Halarsenatibacteraceae bacterium]
MKIMGIDPGLAALGYAFVEKNNNSFQLIEYDVIETSSDLTDVKRLKKIYERLQNLIKDNQPDCMAVEELFFNKNVKTAIRVGQARGVILLAGADAGLKVSEYTPLQVKQAVVGYGRASKHQVQHMVKALLNLESIPEPDDAADALAVAICHGHNYGFNKRWGDQI